MMLPPRDPTKEKKISFVQAVKDKTGKIKHNFILQQLLQNPFLYARWQDAIAPVEGALWSYIQAAYRQFEIYKKHYLETGEQPDYKNVSFIDAINDDAYGPIEGYYILQQADKLASHYNEREKSSDDKVKRRYFQEAREKYLADKAHYLATGEVPEDA